MLKLSLDGVCINEYRSAKSKLIVSVLTKNSIATRDEVCNPC